MFVRNRNLPTGFRLICYAAHSETAAEEARRQGLTIGGAKAAMDDLSGKVGRVVDVAGKSVSETAR
jgi:hypothetical protein